MRTRRRLAWTGLVLCGLILAVGVASMWVDFGWLGQAHCSCGVVGVAVVSGYHHSWSIDPVQPDISLADRVNQAFSLPTVFDLGRLNPNCGVVMYIPLWLPLFIIAIPTVCLWWRERRYIPPGCCQKCGYDLRGTPERCPECGEPVAGVE